MSLGNAGFTLAEVLITLGIIGVVAGMTIPTLIENNQKAQYVTALKKVYSNFSQVLVQYSADNGCTGDLACTGLFNKTSDEVTTELAPYFKIAKRCGPGVSGCFSSGFSSYIDGSGARDDWSQAEMPNSFITTDGMAFLIVSYRTNCSDAGWSANITEDMTQLCGYIIVDVNGSKGPNNYGRDIFRFWITNGRGSKLYPYGGADDAAHGHWNANPAVPSSWQCSDANPDGRCCSGRIMDEGWEMNY